MGIVHAVKRLDAEAGDAFQSIEEILNKSMFRGIIWRTYLGNNESF